MWCRVIAHTSIYEPWPLTYKCARLLIYRQLLLWYETVHNTLAVWNIHKEYCTLDHVYFIAIRISAELLPALNQLEWKNFQAGALFLRLTSLKMISDILYIRFLAQIIFLCLSKKLLMRHWSKKLNCYLMSEVNYDEFCSVPLQLEFSKFCPKNRRPFIV
jgi:hypothetical protein